MTAHHVLAAGLAAGLLAAAPAARGDTAVDAQIFKPAMDTQGLFSLERARGLKRHDFGLRLASSFASSPLKLDSLYGAGNEGAESVLNYTLTLDFGLALGLTDKLTVALSAPIQRQPLDDGYGVHGQYAPVDPSQAWPGTGFFSVRPEQNPAPSETPTGDARVGAKYQILDGTLGLAVQGVVYVPFGDEDVFAGSATFTYEPKLILERTLGDRGFLAVNVGARLRKGTLVETRNVDEANQVVANDADGNAVFFPLLYVGHEALLAVGGRFAVAPRVSLAVEAYGLIPLATSDACKDLEFEGKQTTCRNGDLTADALAGAFVQVTPDAALGLAAGMGLGSTFDAARSEDFRLLASVSWAPTPEGARAGGRGDADGDGIADGQDICVSEPEDSDGFQDDDGCPDLDNDLDGVLDAKDNCSLEPEDRDGYQDDDGCPDVDNDGDGVADLVDRCPLEIEDKDGFQDDDGCPDEDNDGDGILDKDDQCANEPETVNGYQDEDGCPDQALAGGPRMVQDRIDLQGERVEFEGRSARLDKAARDTLDAVAAVMLQPANQAVRIRVEVGVEQSGVKARDKKRDRDLSTSRAQAVRDYLVGKGVDPRRLDAVGLGSDRPLDPRHPKDPRMNRRVEFIRLNQ